MSWLPTQRDAETIRGLQKKGIHVWKLHEGDPGFQTPNMVREFFKRYQEDTIGYPGASGLKEHVEAWRNQYKRLGYPVSALSIVPTCGASEAITAALFCVTDPGDEVLVFAPVYIGFVVCAQLMQCRLVPIESRFEDGFRLPTRASWEAKVTARTKAVVLINPDNPTGRVASKRELEEVAAFCQKHRLILIADETYRSLSFTNKKVTSVLDLAAHRERIILIDSLSKRAGIPGMRIGILGTYNKKIRDAATKFAMSRGGTARIEQLASIPVLNGIERLTALHKRQLETRIHALIRGLRTLPDLNILEPEGGMFVNVQIPGVYTKKLLEYFLTTFRKDSQTVSFLSLNDFYPSSKTGRDMIRLAAVYEPEQMLQAAHTLVVGIKKYRERSKKRP